MTGFETIVTGVGGLSVPLVLYVANYINSMKKEIVDLKINMTKLEAETRAGDANNKSHILNCENFKPRHNLD